jgi:rubrerythrin
LKSGEKEEMRRLLERVLRYELEAAAMYDSIIAGLKNEKIKERIAGIREAEVRHAELARKELQRFQ